MPLSLGNSRSSSVNREFGAQPQSSATDQGRSNSTSIILDNSGKKSNITNNVTLTDQGAVEGALGLSRDALLLADSSLERSARGFAGALGEVSKLADSSLQRLQKTADTALSGALGIAREAARNDNTEILDNVIRVARDLVLGVTVSVAAGLVLREFARRGK